MQRGELKLGDEARDTITGLKGVVVAITDWLNGCQRITIQPKELKDGRPVDNYTLDIEQCELVNRPQPKPTRPTGGPSISPTRAADPGR